MHWVGELRVIGRLKGYLIDQEVYLSEMLQSFGLTDCKSTDTPKQPGLAVEEHWRANSETLLESGWETDVCDCLGAQLRGRNDLSAEGEYYYIQLKVKLLVLLMLFTKNS